MTLTIEPYSGGKYIEDAYRNFKAFMYSKAITKIVLDNIDDAQALANLGYWILDRVHDLTSGKIHKEIGDEIGDLWLSVCSIQDSCNRDELRLGEYKPPVCERGDE